MLNHFACLAQAAAGLWVLVRISLLWWRGGFLPAAVGGDATGTEGHLCLEKEMALEWTGLRSSEQLGLYAVISEQGRPLLGKLLACLGAQNVDLGA